MVDYSEYAHKDGKIYRLKQDGSTYYLSGISDRKGLDKVPFAFDFLGNEVSSVDAQRYYSYSKKIEEILKELKNSKRVFTTFWSQIFYRYNNEEFSKKLLLTIGSAFSISTLHFLEYPLLAICPDCGKEIVFEYRKIHKGRIPQNFFVHENNLCKLIEADFSRLRQKMSLQEYQKDAIKPLLNITYTKEEFRKKLEEITYTSGKREVKLLERDIAGIVENVSMVGSKYCDFVNETGNHLKARWAIAKAMEKEKDVFLLRKCSKCNYPKKVYFPGKGMKVSLEHMLSPEYRADVALFDKDGNLKAIIEVVDEQPVSEEKEEVLKEIPWIEVSAVTVLRADEWLVKKDHFKPYICKGCKKAMEKDLFSDVNPKCAPVLTGKGNVMLESENHYFNIKLLLKEEYRYSKKLVNLIIKELEDLFKFKVTKIQVFHTDGSSNDIYKFDYSEKLPPDKDEMMVATFVLNSYYCYGSYRVGHYVNALWRNSRSLPFPSKESRIRSSSGIYLPYPDQKNLIKLLSILSRFFFMRKNEEMLCIDYYDCKYGGYHGRRYRKKKKGTYRYSISHENAHESKIEVLMENALKQEKIDFVKQHNLYVDGKCFTTLDFYIEQGKIAIYCDGFQYHYNKDNVIKDRYQDRELQYLGYCVLRFTGSEIVGDLGKCIDEIKRFIKKFA